VYRQWDGHDDEAAAAFRTAWELDAGMAGTAGRRWYLRFHADPSLEFGWLPHHCSTSEVTWHVEDVPTPVPPGSYDVTLRYTKGRHALLITRVELLDGDRSVASAVHDGRAGSSNSANVYNLDVPSSVAAPVLRITCRTDGGADSHGQITFVRR